VIDGKSDPIPHEAMALGRDDEVAMGAQSQDLRRPDQAGAGLAPALPRRGQGSVTTYSSGIQPTEGGRERKEPAGTLRSARAAKQ